MNLPLIALLDPRVIRRIPLQFTNVTGLNVGSNTDAWVWIFLRTVLSTAVPFDEAAIIINYVQASYLMEGR